MNENEDKRSKLDEWIASVNEFLGDDLRFEKVPPQCEGQLELPLDWSGT